MRTSLPRLVLTVFVAATLLTGCQQAASTDTGPSAEVQAAISKSEDWYGKGIYELAEAEARKASATPSGQWALFRSLAKQESAQKLDEAEKIAKSLQSSLKGEQKEQADQFLALRDELREIDGLKTELAVKNADKVGILDQYPKDQRGTAYHSLVFQTLAGEPESLTTSSLAYASAKELMAQPEGPLVEKARTFVEQVDEVAKQAKTPLEAVKRLHADAQKDSAEDLAEFLKGTTIVKATEKVTGEMGKVSATLSFPTPWGTKQRQVTFSCSKRKGAWQVNTRSSDLSSLGIKLGQKEHELTPSGIRGVIDVDQSSFADLKTSLDLVDADALGRMAKSNGHTDFKSEVFLCPSLDVLLVDGSNLELVVLGPKNRLANGVGVGDTVADFCQTHELAYPNTPAMNISGVLPFGYVKDGTIQGVWSIDLITKEDEPVLVVYLNGPSIVKTGMQITRRREAGGDARDLQKAHQPPTVQEIMDSRVIAMGYTKEPLAKYKR